MAAKAFLVICVQALFVQMSLAQAIFPVSKLSANPTYGSINLGSSGFGSSGFGSSGFSTGGLIGSGIASGGLTTSGSSLVGIGSNGATNIVSGGPLLVTAISPIGPSGLAVASENIIEGILTVNGQLPYLSAVAFEGSLPTAGSGSATCGCGSNSVGIISEGLPNRGGRVLY